MADDVGVGIEVGEGVRCVPLRGALTDRMHEAVRTSTRDLARWVAWVQATVTAEDTAAWVVHCEQSWSRGSHFEFAIVEGSSYLGSCALTNVEPLRASADLSYWIRSDRAGRGLAARAARRVAAWGVAAQGLREIRITMATANVAARRVAERAGGVLEGVFPGRLGGRPCNFAHYVLTPADFHLDELTSPLAGPAGGRPEPPPDEIDLTDGPEAGTGGGPTGG